MPISPFHAFYKATNLSSYAFGDKTLIPSFASSDIEIYPYQIAAAKFALRSPYLKGAILCDEGSLGKTYEAMLVVTQMWYEGKQNILIVVPTPLLYQWTQVIENRFSIPYFCIDNNVVFDDCLKNGDENPFLQDGVIITTYDFAVEKYAYLENVSWNLSVFEEAHHLRRIYTKENKGAALIKNAVKDSFKLLLTATPMQNSILDLYGLITFIDDTVLPDEQTFYKRYFRRPENYSELADRVSKYCFRATRAGVSKYIKIPERIPITAEFALNDDEQRLYDLIERYIEINEKIAFPKMDKYDLALMLFRTFSSSTFALTKTLQGVLGRLKAMHEKDKANLKITEEMAQVRQMLSLSKSIKENSKGTELLIALKEGFVKLKKLGANKKALIFTENRATQKYLYKLLNKGEYKGKVLLFNGDHSRDYGIMTRFKKDANILITTDLAAEGFNLEFCSFIINYDLPYNTLTVEQRINRCHRQGQQCDVIVLNFLNKNNFADVRMLELINKRILQFSGIFGMSDAPIGNFGIDLSSSFSKVLGSARPKKEIDAAFNEVLEKYEEENQELVKAAEHSLFTSFSSDIINKVVVTPQYIENEIKKINDDLWDITKYFFENRFPFHINEETRTVSCFGTPPRVFTGAAMRRNEYSMDKKYQPRSGRHTITGTLAKNILHEIFWAGIPDSGTVEVEGQMENCTIGYYKIKVKPKDSFWGGIDFYTFVGKTQKGKILDDDECRALMDLPVTKFVCHGETYGDKDGISKEKPHNALDDFVIVDEFLQKAAIQMDTAVKYEIERLKFHTQNLKLALNKDISSLQSDIKLNEKKLLQELPRNEILVTKKEIAILQKELKQKEQNLFLDGLRLEQDLDDKINKLIENSKMVAEVKMGFVINVYGK